MCRVLLDPLGPGGDRKFQTAVYDRETDTALCLPSAAASAGAVLLFDGVFLLRPDLINRWDLSIFMSVTFDRTRERAQARGTALAGGNQLQARNRRPLTRQSDHQRASAPDRKKIKINNRQDRTERPSPT